MTDTPKPPQSPEAQKPAEATTTPETPAPQTPATTAAPAPENPAAPAPAPAAVPAAPTQTTPETPAPQTPAATATAAPAAEKPAAPAAAPAAPKPAAPAAAAPPKPAAPPPPPPKTIDEIVATPYVAAAANRVRDAITAAKEFAGEITLTIERTRIREACEAFRAEGYDYLVDLTGLDYSTYPGHTGPRFAVAYLLYSFKLNERVRLKVFAAEGESIPSVSSVWKTANWHERETFDMYGIQFDGHPNLERILMWDEFNGHPLRKDFPLRGIDTGARIYPEMFPEGGGPKEGATGKAPGDINLWNGPWTQYGRGPITPPDQVPTPKALPAAGGHGKTEN